VSACTCHFGLFAAMLFMYVSQFCGPSAFVLAMSMIHYDCD